MTTHLRARAVQAGALLALVGGMLAVASSPALAKDPAVQIQNVQSRDLPSGGRTALTFTVTNPNQGAPTPISVNVNGNGFSCNGDCSPQTLFNPNDTKTFNIQLTAPAVDAGQTRTIQVQITANGPGGDTGQASQQFTVRGADKPRTVRQVTGRVKDQDGKSVPGANVGMKDSQGHTFVSISNDEGRFQFTSSDQNPIVPGNLTVGAAKDGFEGATVNVQGGADKTVNVPLTLQAKEARASASPSATATASPTAAADAADPATEEASAPPATDPQNAASNDGGSSMLFIILGALLVAAGIGAIVLLLMRRRGNNGDGPDDPDGIGGGPSGPVPSSQGRYNGLPDSTRVAAPVGGRANDATMVARGGSSISDAPTMMQQAVPLDDEFPDPYGAPAVPGGGYAGAGGYGAAAAGAYGGATQYGAGGAYGGAQVPAQSGGYDAGPATQYGRPPVRDEDPYGAYAPGGGGYGGGAEQPRYDEPTGMYRPEFGAADGGQDDGYGYGGGDRYAAPEPEYPRGGQAPGAYQGGGYGGGQEPQDGYGQWGAPAGGIDSGNAYGAPAGGGSYGGGYGGESYGQPAGGSYGGGRGEDRYDDAGQGGYDQREAYGGGRPSDAYDRGYEQQSGGGYGAADQYGRGDQSGYYGGQDQARGDQGGGRHGGGQSRADSSQPGQRRPLDWMDD